MELVQVFKPFHDEREIEAVTQVIRSGWWGQGPVTADLETRFAAFVHAPAAVAVNSATTALHLALMVAGVEGGDVITTPMTFVSTNHAILYNHARPVFADIESDTLNIDPVDIARKITPQTRAIMVVHFGGHPCDMRQIWEIAGAYHLVVIEDAAHAAGARYMGRPVGGLSPLTCFSFHAVKNIACGDGGMITLRNLDWAERLKRLRWMGITKDTWTRSKGDGYTPDYDVTEVGFKCHMNDLSAALARVQLERLSITNQRRRDIAAQYDANLGDLGWLQLPVEKDYGVSARHNYVVQCDDRDSLAEWLREKGIATGIHYVPNHLHQVYRQYAVSLPVAERAGRRVLTLPLHPGLTDGDVERVITAVRLHIPKIQVLKKAG